jgi:hypothetical protein
MNHNNNFPKDKDFSNSKQSTASKTANPFTETGLKIAMIDDLNDQRWRIEYLEKEVFGNKNDSIVNKLKNERSTTGEINL